MVRAPNALALICVLLSPVPSTGQQVQRGLRESVTAMLRFRGEVVGGEVIVDRCSLERAVGAETAAQIIRSVGATFVGDSPTAARPRDLRCFVDRHRADRRAVLVMDSACRAYPVDSSRLGAPEGDEIRIDTHLVLGAGAEQFESTLVAPVAKNIPGLWRVREYRVLSMAFSDEAGPREPPRPAREPRLGTTMQQSSTPRAAGGASAHHAGACGEPSGYSGYTEIVRERVLAVVTGTDSAAQAARRATFLPALPADSVTLVANDSVCASFMTVANTLRDSTHAGDSIVLFRVASSRWVLWVGAAPNTDWDIYWVLDADKHVMMGVTIGL